MKAVPTYEEIRCELQGPRGNGAKVTLRGDRMYELWTDFSQLPRVRDFKGINPNAFDGRGNYAHQGLKEQLIFPEIEFEKVEKVRGMISPL